MEAQTVPARPIGGNRPPEYPEQARQAMVAGEVVFRATVSEQGLVISVGVLKVPEKDLGFEKAVQTAVESWRFDPARDGDTRVPFIYVGKIDFSLRSDDEKAIRDIAERGASAWNSADPEAIAALFDSDGYIHSVDQLAAGRAEVEAWFGKHLVGPYEGTRLRATMDMIRFLPSGDAQADLTFEITGILSGNDRKLSGTSLHVTALMRKQGEQWLITDSGAVHGWDRKPILVYKPPAPPYPSKAKEKMVTGEVVLEILVKLDGSTQVLRVLRSLRYCTEAAIEHAKQWRWTPAIEEGKRVEAVGIITVRFDLFSGDGDSIYRRRSTAPTK